MTSHAVWDGLRSIVAGLLTLLVLGVQRGHAETVTGTGFAVTADGVIITNYHVISECRAPIKARLDGSPDYLYEATLLAGDPDRDLAALKIGQRTGLGQQWPEQDVPRAIFRHGPALQQGETAITYGFPLHGLLAQNGNVTLGYVSALSGMRDDHRYIQVTTPVQQGNSGGPLYDHSGHIIGVVVAKLDALKVMLATGDVPQNVNFAISVDTVRQFVSEHNWKVVEEDSSAELQPPEIAKKARQSTYLIECLSNSVAQPKAQPSTPRAPTPSQIDLACVGPSGYTTHFTIDEQTSTVIHAGMRLRAIIDRNEISFKFQGDDGTAYYHHISRSTGAMIVVDREASTVFGRYSCKKAQRRF
jgi:Trypsin-like peptidase domain